VKVDMKDAGSVRWAMDLVNQFFKWVISHWTRY
jgi:hypothetical protein